MIDVDNTDSRFLRAMATIVGVDLNLDIPILRQREEIKRAVEVYKRKGTLFGIRRQVEVITGLTASIDEMADNLLVANKPDRVSVPAFPNSLFTPLRPGDLAGYSVDISDDRIHNPDVVIVFINGIAALGLSRAAVLKMARVLGNFSPIDVLLIRIYIDPIISEIFDRNRLTDSAQDAFDADSFIEQALRDQQGLLSNDPVRLSNDVLFLSGHTGPKRDRFFDVITGP